MRRIALVIILGLFCQWLVADQPPAEAPREQAAESADDQAAEPTVIVEKAYRMLATSDDKEIGTFTIRAVETGQAIEVVVDVSVEDGGDSVQVVTSMNYGQSSADPVSGQVETFVDGDACMTGTIELGETTYSYSGQGFRDDRSGEVLDPPLEFAEADLPRPDGPIVFVADFAVMAPRLLTEAGTLENVTLAWFPDDIGPAELVALQEGGALVRKPADADGNVVFDLYWPVPTITVTSEEPGMAESLGSSVTYNADGEIADYQPNDAWRLVEVARDQPAEDGEPAEEAGTVEDTPSEEGDDD